MDKVRGSCLVYSAAGSLSSGSLLNMICPKLAHAAGPQYRPTSFDKFIVHRDIADNLQKLVGFGSWPMGLRRGCRLPSMLPATCFAGGIWRLPTYAAVWASWCGKENPGDGAAQGGVWPRCGEGEAVVQHVMQLQCSAFLRRMLLSSQ